MEPDLLEDPHLFCNCVHNHTLSRSDRQLKSGMVPNKPLAWLSNFCNMHLH